MRSRRPRSRAIIAIATVALLASACSAFNPLSDVQTKKVAVDLTFGAKVDPNKVTPEDPLRPVTPRAPELPDRDRGGSTPPPPPSALCPPPTALGAKYPAPTSVRDGLFDPETPNSGNMPPDDSKFLFFFAGNREGQSYRQEFGYKTIDALGNDPYPQGWSGTHYRVSNPFNGINIWFSVVPPSEAIDDSQSQADGLFLRRIEIPMKGAKKGDQPLVFSPASAETSGGLRLLHFPVQPGEIYEDSAEDVGSKANKVGEVPETQPGVPHGPVYATSANTLRSVANVGGRDTFPVCDQFAQGWKTTIELRSSGEYNWQMVGTFWLGTHIGGWPLKADFIFDSEDDKLISGNFFENMARLDPGDYI